jgi:hypothetical protein
MSTERIITPETKNQLPDIPKSKEIYSGDINDAVITVQQVTGFEITPEWWAAHVGNNGSTEKILERFDSAFEKFVREQVTSESVDEQEVDHTEIEQTALREAGNEYDKFNEQFKDDPDYDKLSGEFLIALHTHLMNKYFSGETTESYEEEPNFGIAIELSDEYDDTESRHLADATKQALEAVDTFLDGETKNIFSGLTIKIGEGVASGGGEAIADKNTVALNGRPMLMSISEMREKAGYEEEELTGGIIDENEPAGALQYTLVHEMGHIIDELTESGDKMHRVSSAESPTVYGREPDQYNTEKDHEAFAEGFAHLVYGMPVSETLAKAIQETIQLKLAEIR